MEIFLKDAPYVFSAGEFQYALIQVLKRLPCRINSFEYYHESIQTKGEMDAFNELCFPAADLKVRKVFFGNLNINSHVDVGSGFHYNSDFLSPELIVPVVPRLECVMLTQDNGIDNTMRYNQENVMLYKIDHSVSAITGDNKFALLLNGFIFNILENL